MRSSRLVGKGSDMVIRSHGDPFSSTDDVLRFEDLFGNPAFPIFA
jgi:hypothetical protein